jgi:hypothetical protein
LNAGVTVVSVAEIAGQARLALAPRTAPAGEPPERTGRDTPAETDSTAARPGAPVARLSLDAQTAAQESSDESGKEEAKPPQGAAEKAATEAGNGEELTDAEKRQVEKLKQRDRVVREHERAHATAGGSIAGSPSFTFVTGPDGKQYAVGGEVSIDASPVPGNPKATIRKLEQVKRAALAPSNPSSQDRRVASQADAEILKAKQELSEQRREEQAESTAGRGDASDSIGSQDPVFDPEGRFRQPVGSAGQPLGTGLAGGGELRTNVGLTRPGDLLNLVA